MVRFLSLLFLCFYAPFAMAQEYLDQAICFTLVNQAPYMVIGDVSTDEDTYKGDIATYSDTPQKIHHTASFRMAQDETFDICTTGPLYEGGKVRLTLRTFVPVFECLTNIYAGARINIRGKYIQDEFRTETWAECL